MLAEFRQLVHMILLARDVFMYLGLRSAYQSSHSTKTSVIHFKSSHFHMSGKSQTMGDIGKSPDICPRFDVFISDRCHFYLSGESGELERNNLEVCGNELKLSPTFLTV